MLTKVDTGDLATPPHPVQEPTLEARQITFTDPNAFKPLAGYKRPPIGMPHLASTRQQNEGERHLMDYYVSSEQKAVERHTRIPSHHEQHQLLPVNTVVDVTEPDDESTRSEGDIAATISIGTDAFVERMIQGVRESCQRALDAKAFFKAATMEEDTPIDPRRSSMLLPPLGASPRESHYRTASSPLTNEPVKKGSGIDAGAGPYEAQLHPNLSRSESPDPRAPSKGLYATDTASTNTRRGRSGGVSRERCSSMEVEVFEVSGSSSHSTSPHHPCKWTPRPVNHSRPAWNQNKPPPKPRPQVSAPGTTPPHVARPSRRSGSASDQLKPWRRSASRSPSGQLLESKSGVAQSTTTLSASRSPSAEKRPRSSGKYSRCYSSSSVPQKGNDSVTQVKCGVSDAGDVLASARVLFHDVSRPAASVRSHPALEGHPESVSHEAISLEDRLQTLEKAVQLANERAERAENKCAVLEKELTCMAEGNKVFREKLTTEYTRLAVQAQYAAQWVHAFEGSSTPLTPSQRVGCPSKDGCMVSTGHEDGGSDSTPGYHGVTPTPARECSSSTVRTLSNVRIPPSPPMVLQLQS